MEKKQPFRALSKICLNNWHYIDRKILTFSQGINFFTGHSGSGKSTVIDALQIVLYANTDGRAFFNKAAADDSDRSLIEYLRGMVNIGENNEFQYLRNKNFSSTIVLEFEQTDTKEKQCVGVLKLLYDEQMASASSSSHAAVTMGMLNGKAGEFHVLGSIPSPTEMRRTIALLKKYQIIEPLDILEELDENTRLIIYPCINAVLAGDDIMGLLNTFSEEEYSGEETAVQGTIEDMSE